MQETAARAVDESANNADETTVRTALVRETGESHRLKTLAPAGAAVESCQAPLPPNEPGHPEEPRLKRSKLGLDDSDAEPATESEDEIPFDLSSHLLPSTGAALPQAATENPDNEVVKRHIRGKRPADGTDFPARALVQKAEHDRLKGIEAEKASKVRKLNKAAARTAEQSFAQNPEAYTSPDPPSVDVAVGWRPHISHDIRQMATHPISYCNTCGWFANNRAAHSKLREECEDIKKGSRTTLRLLQCDIVPTKGAKLPLHLRKRNWAPFDKRR